MRMDVSAARRSLFVAVAAAFVLAACGTDDPAITDPTDEAPTAAPTDPATAAPTATEPTDGTTTPVSPPGTASPGTETPTETAAGEALEITGVDYSYEGVPDTVDAGTQLTFTNASRDEAHEMAVFRIDDEETRSVQELLQMDQDEIMEVVEFAGVGFALPGSETVYPEGDIVVSEPGRYAMACFIPVGADPQALADAAQQEGTEPPDLGDGPPHFLEGMWSEFRVQ